MKRLLFGLACSAVLAVVVFLSWQATRPDVTPLASPRLPPTPSIRELAEELQALHPNARAAAAWALAGAEDLPEEVEEALLDQWEHDPSELAREAAAWALFRPGRAALRDSRLAHSAPKPLTMTRPDYPRAAFKDGLQGTVRVDVLISAAGRVVHAEVRESIPGLDESALRAVGQRIFEPGRRDHGPVPVVVAVPLAFRIY